MKNHRYVFVVVGMVAAMLSGRAGATVYSTSDYGTYQDVIDLVQPGDAVNFDGGGGGTITVDRAIDDVQFINGSADWVINADVSNCLFYRHRPTSIIQHAGRFRKNVLYIPGYATVRYEFTHIDSVSFYCEMSQPSLAVTHNPNNGHTPQLQLYGFVRAVTVHKPWAHLNTGNETPWTNDYAPSVRIWAWDDEGDGRNSYIIGPFAETGRAWTPYEVIEGRGITLANICTEQAKWAHPAFTVHRGEECVVLGTAIGGRSSASHEAYMEAASLIQYADHTAWGHDNSGTPYRGAAYRLGGQKNRVVQSGNYKTWSIGMKPYLPGLHYTDGTLARDPFFGFFPSQAGWLSANLTQTMRLFVMWKGLSEGFQSFSGYDHILTLEGNRQGAFPAKGADLWAPVLLKIPSLRTAGGGMPKALGPSQVSRMMDILRAGGTAKLASGTYYIDETITSGEVIGAGPDMTTLVFSKNTAVASGPDFQGFTNLTIQGGTWGFASSGSSIGARFVGSVFDGQTEGGIQINGNTQNDVIQDAVFRNSKVGITCGTYGSAGGGSDADPFLDRLAIANCTFENLSENGIILWQDGNHTPNGATSVHNCTFRNIGAKGIRISSGRAYVAQACSLWNVGQAVHISSAGGASASHIYVNNTTTTPTGPAIDIDGHGVISHCSITGFSTAVRAGTTESYELDNITADGAYEVNGEAYIANCTFSNLSGAGKGYVVRKGGSVEEVAVDDVQPDVTPPPAVPVTYVLDRGTHTTVMYSKVTDAESGIQAYALFDKATETEIARTLATFDAAHPYQPEIYLQDTLVDPNPAHIGYQAEDYVVRAINGAGLLSGGGLAALREWTFFQGQWFDFDWNPVYEEQFDNVSGTGSDLRVTIDGTVHNPSSDWTTATIPDRMVQLPGEILDPCSDYSAGPCPEWGPGSNSVLPGVARAAGVQAIRLGPNASWFSVAETGAADIALFDAAGRQVAVLFSGRAVAGKRYLLTPPRNRASGLWIVRARCQGMTQVRTLHVVQPR